MKIAPNQVERYLARLDPSLVAYLVYGPDQGLVSERARRLAGLVVDDLQDPFLVADMDGDQIRQEPSRLFDEAYALSMIGGRRVVRIRQAGDFLSKSLAGIADLSPSDALIVVEAGDLGPSSSLRRWFERAQNAAAIASYREEGRSIAVLVDQMLQESGMGIERDAKDQLINSLGADHELSKREIEKLILLHSDRASTPISSDDVAEALGESTALAIDDWVFAALLDQSLLAEDRLKRLLAEGQSAIRLLRAMSMIVKRLSALKSSGGDAAGAVAKAKPPIHFKQRRKFEAALNRHSATALADIWAMAAACEVACKTTGRPHGLLASHLTYNVCEIARKSRGARR